MAVREKLHALVLGRRDINEADRLLTLFTRPRGLVRVIAKGVRRIPSRRGGHMEPFAHVVCIVTGSPGRLYLQAVETVEDHAALRQDAAALEHSLSLARLLLATYQEEEADEEMFDALLQACRVLPQITPEKRVALETALAMYVLQANGLQPELHACQTCGANVPQDAVVLDALSGGWQCISCRPSFNGSSVSLTPRSLKALKWLAIYPQRALQLKMMPEEAAYLLAAVRGYMAGVRGDAVARQSIN